jgi:hypothetical protein
MTKRNFLLAKGERLTKDVIVRTGSQPKEAPYTFAEARARHRHATARRFGYVAPRPCRSTRTGLPAALRAGASALDVS